MEARKIGEDSLVDLMLHLKWKSEAATHTDAFQANRVNIWRDFLPPNFLKGLMGRQAGERIEVPLEAEDLVPEFNNRHLFQVKKSQFGQQSAKGKTEAPEVGRFYPKGLLKDLTDVFATNVKPFRCVQLDKDQMTVDFNHPLAGKELALSTVIGEVDTKRFERGGASIDWFEALTSGPGMQARWQNTPSQFFTEEAFRRKNEEADARFYKNPRLVQHIDDTAIEIVKDMYSGLLKDGMQVLDLMSSWQSHLPDDLTLGRLVGLGMNENELKSNPHLNETIVQDLNDNSTLPFDTGVFDAALCSLSIEYLVDPIAVFEEISRVLRPGGQFIVTFSNRWFPPKAVSIWPELHEFERMGLVLEYFLRSGRFNHLRTYSMRGLPRPHGDKYFPSLMYSDPVYAVWGQKL